LKPYEMKTFVKICGITNIKDVNFVANSGVDFLGVILEIEGSPRSVSIERAKNIIDCSSIPVILLLEKPFNEIKSIIFQLKPHGVQLIGNYSSNDIKKIKKSTQCAVWKTIRIPQKQIDQTPFIDLVNMINENHNLGVDIVVLDTLVKKKKGGTGQTCDWWTAAKLVKISSVPVFLSGGITPTNVGAAINQVKPYGVDLSSGVEKKPGQKDPKKITELMQKIKTMTNANR